jgi:hypothetical protein
MTADTKPSARSLIGHNAVSVLRANGYLVVTAIATEAMIDAAGKDEPWWRHEDLRTRLSQHWEVMAREGDLS